MDLFNLFRSLSKFSCVMVCPRVLLGRNPIIYISVSQKPAVGFAYNVIRTAFYLLGCLPRKMPSETMVHIYDSNCQVVFSVAHFKKLQHFWKYFRKPKMFHSSKLCHLAQIQCCVKKCQNKTIFEVQS